MIDPALVVVLRVTLALLFVTAALHKLRDLQAFRVALGDYELVPWPLTGIVAAGLAAAELGVAGMLLTPWARPWGFAAAALLLALYTAAVSVNLLRGRRAIDCGCFGPALRLELGPGLVARNALLIAGALTGLLPATARALSALDLLPIVASIGFLCAAQAAASRLLANAPALRALRGES